MSQLGHYIHLSWSGYTQYGTHTAKEGKSNFIPHIFDLHYYDLKEKIKSQKITNLANLEKEYNIKNKEAFKLFYNLDKQDKEDKSILRYLLSQINSTWTRYTIEAIIDGLQWNSSKDTFEFKPTGKLAGLYKNKNSTSVPSLRWDSKSGWHKVKPIKEYAKKLSKYIEALSQDAEDKSALDNDISKITTEIIPALNGVEQLTDTKTQSIAQKIYNKSASKIEKSQFKIWQKILSEQKERLDNIRIKYISAEEINLQIQAALAEIFGNFVARGADTIAKETLKEEIKKAISVGRETSSIEARKNSIISINATFAEEEYQRAETEGVVQIMKKNALSNGKFSYGFSEIGQGRAQKRDVELSINERTYGISVKNTNLAQDYAKALEQNHNFQGATISLQSSSLMLYLLGMEQEWSNMGNHYLNIFATHEKDNVNNNGLYRMYEMRTEAMRSLKLYVLYSAMTGKGQLRSEDGAADILAVYDKASTKNKEGFRRIKLYDMSELILKIADTNFKQGINFSPDINSQFYIENERADTVGYRLSQTLANARRKNIAVSLFTQFLT